MNSEHKQNMGDPFESSTWPAGRRNMQSDAVFDPNHNGIRDRILEAAREKDQKAESHSERKNLSNSFFTYKLMVAAVILAILTYSIWQIGR